MIEQLEDKRSEQPTGLAGGTPASTFTPRIRFLSCGTSLPSSFGRFDERADR